MQSDTINELAKALAKAQGQIKAAVKARANTFYKSSYADLPSVMEACRKALSENDIAVVQATQFTQELGMWIETTLMHSSGQWIRGSYPVSPTRNDPQGYGSAMSYARRYALMGMVGVVADDEDDDGEAAVGRGSYSREQPVGISKRQADDMIPTADDRAQAERIKAEPSKASKWADDQLLFLSKVNNNEAFENWHKDNTDKIASLINYDKAKHKLLIAQIEKTRDKLKGQN